MQSLALWLCEPTTTAAGITQSNLQPPTFASAIEADWLWNFLQRIDAGQPLLTCAQTLASMLAAEKVALRSWVQTVSELAAQFQSHPTAWPEAQPSVPGFAWKTFKSLMVAFYEKGLRSGLPYLPDGTPASTGGVTYASFLQGFRNAHRLNPDPDAREVCVLCGDKLGQPEVDHWIAKGTFPLLSVCADNLLPICGECNSTANKGEKAVHSGGSFANWFHPYLRPANGAIRLHYAPPDLKVRCTASVSADQSKVDNLDKLLNLSDRWTREFKAEYLNQQGVLRQREQRRIDGGRARHTQAEVQGYIQQVRDDLVPSEPNHEVHQLLCVAMQEQARLAAWQTELGLVS